MFINFKKPESNAQEIVFNTDKIVSIEKVKLEGNSEETPVYSDFERLMTLDNGDKYLITANATSSKDVLYALTSAKNGDTIKVIDIKKV